jgi:hypothetical protein
MFADSGYRGISNRSRRKRVGWSVESPQGKREALDSGRPIDAMIV